MVQVPQRHHQIHGFQEPYSQENKYSKLITHCYTIILKVDSRQYNLCWTLRKPREFKQFSFSLWKITVALKGHLRFFFQNACFPEMIFFFVLHYLFFKVQTQIVRMLWASIGHSILVEIFIWGDFFLIPFMLTNLTPLNAIVYHLLAELQARMSRSMLPIFAIFASFLWGNLNM